MWACLGGDSTRCGRREVLLNFNTVCDDGGGGWPRPYATECPAPKAALRVGDLKLLAECYAPTPAPGGARARCDTRRGRVGLRCETHRGASPPRGDSHCLLELYNLTADPSESANLAAALPDAVASLRARLLAYGAQATQIPPLSDAPPWQGAGYYCAHCTTGRPKGAAGAWDPWCDGDAGVAC
eukprot:1542576-Prymnesium_polylepis.2